MILELRRSLVLPLDDIVEAMRRCLDLQLSRRGVHRCLKRHGRSARATPQPAPAAAFRTETPAGFIQIDVKYLAPLSRRRRYASSLPQRRLGSRSTAPPALSISKFSPIAGRHRRGLPGARSRPLPAPGPHHPRPAPGQALTDNGSQFTDRFAVDKKQNPRAGPPASIPPASTPSTRPAPRAPSPAASPSPSVADYNRTRLRCLDYQAPAELIVKLAGHNT